MRMVVVLPLPFGPRKPKMWPAGTSIEKFSMTRRCPSVLARPRTLIASSSDAMARASARGRRRERHVDRLPGRSAVGCRGLASTR